MTLCPVDLPMDLCGPWPVAFTIDPIIIVPGQTPISMPSEHWNFHVLINYSEKEFANTLKRDFLKFFAKSSQISADHSLKFLIN